MMAESTVSVEVFQPGTGPHIETAIFGTGDLNILIQDLATLEENQQDIFKLRIIADMDSDVDPNEVHSKLASILSSVADMLEQRGVPDSIEIIKYEEPSDG